MAAQPLLILTALEREARALAGGLKLQRVGRGEYRGKGVVLRVIGPGGGCLPGELGETVARGVVLAGLGGGLDPALEVGEVVMDAGDWAGAVPVGARQGRICSAERIVATVQEKAALFAATGALAVDMESGVVRRWAKERGQGGLPLLVVRGISDSAGEALDPALAGLVDGRGCTRGGAVAGLLLRHPGRVGALWRLGRVSARALERVGEVVAAMRNAECGMRDGA